MTVRSEVRRLERHLERTALEHMRFAPWAIDFMASSHYAKLARGGNQLGKTTVILWDMLCVARGVHPFREVPRPPNNLFLMSESWEQMGSAGGFMEKLWQLTPRHEIDDGIRFEPGRGISGKPPRIVFTRGPGEGSVISLATFRQGAARMAGVTVDAVGTDEPPPGQLIDELTMRLMAKGGQLSMNFTPVLDMPDQSHLRQLVADGVVAEWNPWLTEENCWPVGAPFPWIRQAQIERSLALCSPGVRDMREKGAWERVSLDRLVAFFDRALHVAPRRVEPPTGARLAVGMDHSTKAKRQTAALVAGANTTTLRPRVWAWAEVQSDTVQTDRDFARSVLRMLASRDVHWRDVDVWVGDRATAPDRTLKVRSNEDIRRQLADLVGVDLEAFPPISTPIKRSGSVEAGCHTISGVAALRTGDYQHLQIDPSCEGIAAFLEHFDGDPEHKTKDIGDAFRYAVEALKLDIDGATLLARY